MMRVRSAASVVTTQRTRAWTEKPSVSTWWGVERVREDHRRTVREHGLGLLERDAVLHEVGGCLRLVPLVIAVDYRRHRDTMM
jgi:hypothetical protein